jgi:hypothetical protein
MLIRKPYFGVPWATCGTCGLDVPVTYITLTRKHGWQCLPGSGMSPGCFDGNYDRDDIQFMPPSGEGTRRSAAPTVDAASGGGPTDTPTVWLRDRAVPAAIYAVAFGPNIDFNIDSVAAGGAGGIYIPGGFAMWIEGGSFQWNDPGTSIPADVAAAGLVAIPSLGSLVMQAGSLEYTP